MYICIYLCNKYDANSGVWAYEFDQHLRTNIVQQFLNVFSYERILHNSTPERE